MCTLTKDIHYLCPSKPFIQDKTDGICSIAQMMPMAKCPTVLTPQAKITKTQAEIVGAADPLLPQQKQFCCPMISTTLPQESHCPVKLYWSVYHRMLYYMQV